MEPLIWLIALSIFIVVEIITLGLATIWFACGALAAFIASLFEVSIPVQFVLFAVVSLASLFTVRPYVARKFTSERTKTNYESLIGKSARVVETIDNYKETGVVYINGLEWTARAVDDATIDAGKIAEIIEIRGVKVIVKEKKEEQ
ncbi:MAG TPA: NfeD family protein [Lachnospiraceae bacterium]|nr:NfeD family protein [uncultured Lachnoclostridium sp.]HAU83956.1 NfeD family protein [Lachnospiraceae bacterium]